MLGERSDAAASVAGLGSPSLSLSLSEGKQSAALVNCDALLTFPDRSPEGESLPRLADDQLIMWGNWDLAVCRV